jgi:hypothetical protein
MKIKNEIKKILTIVSPTLETKVAFRSSFGKKLNLKNPKDINEKILWLKLNTYNNNELVTNCIDKYRIREYLKQKGLEELLPKLYGVYDSVEEIEWDKLPKSYVVKCNHGCGYNILVPDSKKLDINQAIINLKKWIKEDYWKIGGEIQYKYINKKIIIEEYLGDVKNYKFYCFNGIPKVMYVSTNEWIENNCEKDKYIDYFDMEFKHINCKLKGHENYDGIIEKPVNFEEMKKVSAILSKDFPFVRVDLYDVNGKVYISELTFVPTAGFMHLNPNNVVEEWGTWLKLNNE